MNSKILVTIALALVLNLGFAQAGETSPSFATADQCSATKILGGDVWPWGSAKPFPWSDIQGVWKLSDGIAPLYLKAKVVRSTSNRKILNLSIVSEGNCNRPVAQGVGYIDFSERNVVRAMLNDGTSKYQMKLASFDVKDLEMDSKTCGGENIMAASLQMIGSMRPGASPGSYTSDRFEGPENIMLKKTSDDLSSICRKLGTL